MDDDGRVGILKFVVLEDIILLLSSKATVIPSLADFMSWMGARGMT